MSADSEKIKVLFSLDSSEFTQSTEQIVSSSKNAEKAIEDLGNASTRAGQQTSAAASEIAKVGTEADRQAKSVNALVDAMKGVTTLPNTMTNSSTGDWGAQVKASIELNKQKEAAIFKGLDERLGKIRQTHAEEERVAAESARAVAQQAEEKSRAESQAASRALQSQMEARAEEERLAGEAANAVRQQAEEKAAAESKAASDAIRSRMEAEAAEQAQYDKTISGLSNTRYALYDVAATWGMVGAASGAALASAVKVSADFESAFTGVERAVEVPVEQMEKIRDDFLDLSAAIPEKFVDLADIGTIGGQLDVAGSNIVSFTENVAKFATMTDATIDNTAMSFGRIDQLANNGIGAFDNIASSVYDVGVQTVATETQIMKMSEELSATASMAGFTADEVIGLSGALASLGAAPERSRGAIERSFAMITNAVHGGGEELQAFANIAGQSADDFAMAWKTKPAEAFSSLVHGLSTLDDVNGALDAVGLNTLRTADVFKRLAGNVDIFDKSMAISANAWTDHSAYMEAYGLVADDLSSKMQMLSNDVLRFIDSIGDNSALASFVDLLRGALRVVQEVTDGINRIPVIGTVFSTGIPAILGVVTAIAAVKAAMLTMRAGLYAVITAQNHMSQGSKVASLSLREMSQVMLGLATTEDILKRKTNETTASIQRLGTGALLTRGSVQGLAVSAGGAGRALVGMVGGVPGLALTALGLAVGFVGKNMAEAEQRTKELEASFAGIGSAVAADTRLFEEHGEALKTVTIDMDGNVLAVDGVRTAHGELIDVVNQTATAFGFSGDAVKEYTMALGEATGQAVIAALSNSETLMNLFKEQGAELERLGVTAEGYAEALMNYDAPEYLEQLRDRQQEINDLQQEMINNDTYLVEAEKYHALTEEASMLTDALAVLGPASEAAASGMAEAGIMAEITQGVTAALGDTAEDAAVGMDELNFGSFNLADTLWGSAMAAADFEGALYNMGQSLYDNGVAFDIFSESGRANMASWNQVVNAAVNASGGDVQALAQMLSNALAMLGEAGVTITTSFARQAQETVNAAAAAVGAAAPQISSLTPVYRNNGVAAGYAARQAAAFSRGAGGAGRSARNAGKDVKSMTEEVRTLTDYVKDLSTLMKNAFEIRWGLQESVDGVAESVQKLQDMKTDALKRVEDAIEGVGDSKDKIKDLRTELAQLNADLATMKADKGTLEYQLGVARLYGDNLRENEILAQIDKLNADIAKKQNDKSKNSSNLTKAEKDLISANKELSDAQSDVTRTLTGNTKSSREQRSAVLDLVQSYQEQIAALANTNMSKEQLERRTRELKAQFERELTQLGYNRTEVLKYSKSLNDAAEIIRKMPKNITISANASPAQRAINEFMAKNKNGRGVSAGLGVPVRANVARPNLSGLQRALNNSNLTVDVTPKVKTTLVYGSVAGKTSVIASLFYSGGHVGQFAGNGGKYSPAGLVHGGEYVFKKEYVDQSTGLPRPEVLRSLLNERPVSSPQGSSSMGGSGTLIVELSPTDRKLIRDSGNAIISLDGKVLARAVNGQNNNSSRRGL